MTDGDDSGGRETTVLDEILILRSRPSGQDTIVPEAADSEGVTLRDKGVTLELVWFALFDSRVPAPTDGPRYQ